MILLWGSRVAEGHWLGPLAMKIARTYTRYPGVWRRKGLGVVGYTWNFEFVGLFNKD